jgi:hypothetical protein
MTIEELDQKFSALAEPVMSSARQQQLKTAIFDLENCANVGELMQLTVADK